MPRAYLLIAGLGLVYFLDLLVHPTGILYSPYSDLLALGVPDAVFQVQSWQTTGALPLWNPYSFGGRPTIPWLFYPLYVPMLWLPVDWLGTYLSWLVPLHVIAAGCFMHLYATRRGLNEAGALTAALAYMFAGKWLVSWLVGGHYLPGLAWLPLVLLGLEQALRSGQLRFAVAAGLGYGLLTLSLHPQWALYAGLFIGLWTLGTALETTGRLSANEAIPATCSLPKALIRWLVFGACTALLGLALAAVQLWPLVEFGRESTRAGGVPDQSLQLGWLALVSLVGPELSRDVVSHIWEERGSLGLIVLALAVMAPVLSRTGRTRFQAVVLLLLVIYALGGAGLLQGVPVLSMLRQPARMLLIVACPVAFLAGTTVHASTASPAPDAEARHTARLVLIVTTVLVAVGVGGLVLIQQRTGRTLHFHGYWLTPLVTVPALLLLLGEWPPHAGRRGGLLCLLVLFDLWALTGPLVRAVPHDFVFGPSASVQFLAKQSAGRILDRDSAERWDFVVDPCQQIDLSTLHCSPLGRGAPLALTERLRALRGYAPVDVARFKEFLQFIGDRDEPMVALQHDFTFPVIGDFPVVNWQLLDLLGTRYLLAPASGPPPPAPWRQVMMDPKPAGYDFILGGVWNLEPYVVYENPEALPRAWVVHAWEQLPARTDVLPRLKSTDFRTTVLLEKTPALAPAPAAAQPRGVRVLTDEPDRVVLHVEAGSPGLLILDDLWFPGWTATVGGRPADILRANFLLRAVVLDGQEQDVVFRFEPPAYTKGKLVSLAAALVGLIGLALAWRSTRAGAAS